MAKFHILLTAIVLHNVILITNSAQKQKTSKKIPKKNEYAKEMATMMTSIQQSVDDLMARDREQTRKIELVSKTMAANQVLVAEMSNRLIPDTHTNPESNRSPQRIRKMGQLYRMYGSSANNVDNINERILLAGRTFDDAAQKLDKWAAKYTNMESRMRMLGSGLRMVVDETSEGQKTIDILKKMKPATDTTSIVADLVTNIDLLKVVQAKNSLESRENRQSKVAILPQLETMEDNVNQMKFQHKAMQTIFENMDNNYINVGHTQKADEAEVKTANVVINNIVTTLATLTSQHENLERLFNKFETVISTRLGKNPPQEKLERMAINLANDTFGLGEAVKGYWTCYRDIMSLKQNIETLVGEKVPNTNKNY